MFNVKSLFYTLILITFGYGPSVYSESLASFTNRCETELQTNTDITGFDCRTGLELRNSIDPSAADCSYASYLTGDCSDGNKMGKLQMNNPDVSAIWVCRRKAFFGGSDLNKFSDVAMIVHNRSNGKSCFFQTRVSGWLPDGSVYLMGPVIPDPEAATEAGPGPNPQKPTHTWLTPADTNSLKCSGCHSNDAYIISPHVVDTFAKMGMMHFANPKGAYSIVGPDFAPMQAAIPNPRPELSCAGSCHFKPSTDNRLAKQLITDAQNLGWMEPFIGSPYYKFNRLAGQLFLSKSVNGLSAFKAFTGTVNEWVTLENNAFISSPYTTDLIAGDTKTYKSMADGTVWRHTGLTACTDTYCPGWVKIGTSGVRITGNDTHIAQQRFNNELWRYTGTQVCSGTNCPGWTKIDVNVDFSSPSIISVANNYIYQLNTLNTARGLARSTGTTVCSGTTCNGWEKLDNATTTVSYATDAGNVYAVRTVNAKLGVWKFNGTLCSGNTCNGWQQLDNNTGVIQIVAGGNELYQLRSDKSVWRYKGTACSGTSCTGWEKIDQDTSIQTIHASASQAKAYKLRTNGSVWRYKNTPCSGSTCTGWEQIAAAGSADSLFSARK